MKIDDVIEIIDQGFDIEDEGFGDGHHCVQFRFSFETKTQAEEFTKALVAKVKE